MIELIKEYSVPKELTAPLLNAMIEKSYMKQQLLRITKEYRKLRYITDLLEELSKSTRVIFLTMWKLNRNTDIAKSDGN